MWIVAGLGNPGAAYASHRHNVGFQIVDALSERYSFSSFHQKGKIAISEGQIEGEKTLILKPLAFMNLSGPPLAAIVHFFKVPLSRVIIIHDELALEPGKIRFKKGGGHGGHNGLKSLESCLGSGFSRIRVGIGHPGEKSLVADYVLSPFLTREKEWLHPLIQKIGVYFPLIFKEQEDVFVSRVMQP